MDSLVSIHAFDRPPNTVSDVVRVLLDGAKPAPSSVKKRTKPNEEALGIPSSVYAYLGRGSDEFGINAVAVPIDSTPRGGRISPFDTGGLVAHIEPVCRWKQDEKSALIGSYSWPVRAVRERLNDYPTFEKLQPYLDGQPPELKGPHEVWRGVTAPIWNGSGNSWQAWTWELRTSHLPLKTKLKYWTCPQQIYTALHEHAASDPKNADLYIFLAERYVPGGLGQILRKVREEDQQ